MSAQSPAPGPDRPPAGGGPDHLLRRLGDQLQEQTRLLHRISEQLDHLSRAVPPTGPLPGPVQGRPGPSPAPGPTRPQTPPGPAPVRPGARPPLSVLPPPSPVDPEHPVRGVPRPVGVSRGRSHGPVPTAPQRPPVRSGPGPADPSGPPATPLPAPPAHPSTGGR